MALTDTELKKAKNKGKPYRLSDSGGLHLVVTPSGGKLWRWKYRFVGKEKLMSFGGYPEVSLAEARERHACGRKLLVSGTDPMAERQARKLVEQVSMSNSFAGIMQEWLQHWGGGKSPRYVASVRRRLEADVLPILGTRPIHEIEAPELVAMTKRIENRGASDLAKRALEMTGMIFRYAIAHGHARRNPATEIRPRDILKTVRKTNYARVDARELAELLRKIEVYRGTISPASL